MIWKTHSNLEGKHAFLGASNYHWIGYSKEKLATTWKNFYATQRGTVLHAFAKQAIVLGIKLPRTKRTLNLYVNDAISMGMKPEQILWYSDNAFGTADAISFRDGCLRIHDLKTGVTPAHMEQLKIYAALFCLEYKVKPSAIDIQLRIYQADNFTYETPDPDEIKTIMDKIVEFDKYINEFKKEEGDGVDVQ